MALLALTLALLAMTVATTANEVSPLDMASASFNDQYQKSSCAMEGVLPPLDHSEFQNNSLFSKYRPWAVGMGPIQWSPVSRLSSSDQAIAIMADHIIHLYKEFNNKIEVTGHSRQAYQDKFKILLNDTFTMLMAAWKEQKCRCVIRRVYNCKFEENVDDIARVGQLTSSRLCKNVSKGFGTTTVFKVQMCQDVYIMEFFKNPFVKEVLIPYFEKFKVTKVIGGGENKQIHLEYIGAYRKYNCECVTGGSVPRTPGHLGKLILATGLLAVATGIL
ncbi:erythroblast NAD(P)(+)--arginine ADP-ribosyltransferase-like [Catharus ustulatus]|uniref:erythroblast NAD(P)(+)--arginine ADP-ribosyltransferase-like n=1 Tax=Catharus ustulatus TaxID=91951 RepID=UPI00140CB1DA|nr:erythroblast NAD(P)(+)--arginine ADP-ribosyltransferase-like [Catharus ustulatus]